MSHISRALVGMFGFSRRNLVAKDELMHDELVCLGDFQLFDEIQYFKMETAPIWAQLIDRLGWVRLIDEYVGGSDKCKLSVGTRVKALLINQYGDGSTGVVPSREVLCQTRCGSSAASGHCRR